MDALLIYNDDATVTFSDDNLQHAFFETSKTTNAFSALEYKCFQICKKSTVEIYN